MSAPSRVVITGGALGIGREFAQLLAERRAKIVLADVNPEAGAPTVRRIRQLGGDALVVRCDVGSADDMGRMAEKAFAWLGEVDLLINNAGILVAGETSNLPLADYQRAIDVNYGGVVHGCHCFLPAMRKRRAGRIINVASLAGVITLPQMGAYNASKAAVIALSETLHAELAREGIDVTVLCPTFTQTHLIEAAQGTATDPTLDLGRTLMRHLGASARQTAQAALEASARGRLYAVPTVHGRLGWLAKRLAPATVTRALGVAHRLAAA